MLERRGGPRDQGNSPVTGLPHMRHTALVPRRFRINTGQFRKTGAPRSKRELALRHAHIIQRRHGLVLNQNGRRSLSFVEHRIRIAISGLEATG